MNLLLLVLLGSFVGYVLVRLLRRSAVRTSGQSTMSELIAGSRESPMVLHAIGLLLLLIAALSSLWRAPQVWLPLRAREAIGALFLLKLLF
jgi:hypothetical protein